MVVVGKHCRAAQGIPAHLRLGSVRIENPHTEITPDRKKDEKTESNAASKDLNNGKAYACKETKVIGSIEDIRKIHESEQKGESGKAQPESDKAEDETSLKDKKEETRSETENIETTDEKKKAEKEETEKAEEIEKDYEEK